MAGIAENEKMITDLKQQGFNNWQIILKLLEESVGEKAVVSAAKALQNKNILIKDEINQKHISEIYDFIKKTENEALIQTLEEFAQAENLPDEQLDKMAENGEDLTYLCNYMIYKCAVAACRLSSEKNIGDAINESYFAAIEGTEYYDKDVLFSQLMGAFIIEKILTHCEIENQFVILPKEQVEQLAKYNDTKTSFEHSNGRQPTLEELGRELDLDADALLEVMELSEKYTPAQNQPLVDIQDKQTVNDNNMDNEILKQMKTVLSGEELDIINLKYNQADEKSVEEIAEILGITSAEVNMREQSALSKIRRLSDKYSEFSE